jgi:hypothetical protein
VKQANERITTVEDGPGTVNERLTTGGPGPEGQPDTVHEKLSGPGVDRIADVPTSSASKADWVDYAVSQGADRETAEGMTKTELAETYGG